MIKTEVEYKQRTTKPSVQKMLNYIAYKKFTDEHRGSSLGYFGQEIVKDSQNRLARTNGDIIVSSDFTFDPEKDLYRLSGAKIEVKTRVLMFKDSAVRIEMSSYNKVCTADEFYFVSVPLKNKWTPYEGKVYKIDMTKAIVDFDSYPGDFVISMKDPAVKLVYEMTENEADNLCALSPSKF
jgi:hypothetical protein